MREIIDPMKDFYEMIGKKEKSLFYFFPAIIGIISFLLFMFIHGNKEFNIINFTNDFINQTGYPSSKHSSWHTDKKG